ncbi:MAG: MCE family protein, partial [Veillonella sp.]|nr:MCE family protein [Veillonella sp.]
GNIVEVGATEKKSSPKVEPSVDLLYNTTDNEFRINGHVRAYNDKGMAELGLSNIGDGTKFDLNAGRFISSKWLVRGGIFESELGLGVDYNLRGPIRLHKDTYGVIQMTRPFGSTNGGTYFGIKQVF